MTNKHVFNHFSPFPRYSDTCRGPEPDPPQTPLWTPSQGGSVVKCTPLVGPVQESPDPEIRQDRWGITKNTLFHVYLSLFIIPNASQRPPDDFLKIDFFENMIFDYIRICKSDENGHFWTFRWSKLSEDLFKNRLCIVKINPWIKGYKMVPLIF